MQIFELKELRNCSLWIICVWSLFCSVRVYINLHFLPIILVKLGFHLSVFWHAFWFFMFLYLWVLVFIFSVRYFEFNVISKDLITFIDFVFTLFKQSLNTRIPLQKTPFQRGFFLKKNAIYKEKCIQFIYKEKPGAIIKSKLV